MRCHVKPLGPAHTKGNRSKDLPLFVKKGCYFTRWYVTSITLGWPLASVMSPWEI